MSSKAIGLVKMLINDQSLSRIMARMPATYWKQWAKERPR
jgi:hypothetical protein